MNFALRGRTVHAVAVIAFGLLLTAAASIASRRLGQGPGQSDRGARGGDANSSAAPILLDGHERLQWDQAGRSLDEVKSLRYMAVFGQFPRDMQDVRCEAKTPSGPFVCSGQLPPVLPGIHQMRLIAVAQDGRKNLISRWSAPLAIEKR